MDVRHKLVVVTPRCRARAIGCQVDDEPLIGPVTTVPWHAGVFLGPLGVPSHGLYARGNGTDTGRSLPRTSSPRKGVFEVV